MLQHIKQKDEVVWTLCAYLLLSSPLLDITLNHFGAP